MSTQLSVTQDTPYKQSGLAASAVRATPTAAIVALALFEAWHVSGSIAAADWLGEAIVAALVLAVAVASGAAVAPPRSTRLAAAALVGLASWDAISLTWSPVPSLARDEALLTLLYAVVLLVPAVTLRGGRDRLLAAGAVAGGVGGLTLAGAAAVATAGSIGAVYYSGRLDFPVSYPNAEAAFALVALWPALALASHRSLPALARAGALAAACAATGAWTAAQSKGGALGLAVSMLVVFGVSRRRLRLAVPVAIVAALTGAFFRPLTAPYRSYTLAVVQRTGSLELVLAAAGAAAGLLYALADRRLEVGDAATRRLGRITAATLVVAVVGGAGAFYARVHDPADFFAARWQSFKHLPTHGGGSSHFVSLGSNRYDFWRVAIQEFEQHPLGGIGARGFRDAYLRHRRSGETPARAHSVELDALSETGIVGFLLLAVGLASAVAAFARRARDDVVAIGALGAFACWLAHASVDWTWSFPAIGLPLFTLLGAAAARGAQPRLKARTAMPLAALAAGIGIGAFGVPWLSAHYVRAALSRPADAGTDLHRARILDPLSTDPLLAAWALAPTPQAAVAPLVTAVRMEPRSPDLLYALGRQQYLAGQRVAARRTLGRALALDPGEPVIVALLHRLRAHPH